MPTYVYGLAPDSSAAGCAKCRGHFECFQKMSDPPLEKCPDCGAPIVRLIQPPMLGSTEMLKGPSEKTLKQAGFTQYKRSGKGHYEKTFGGGPDSLHP